MKKFVYWSPYIPIIGIIIQIIYVFKGKETYKEITTSKVNMHWYLVILVQVLSFQILYNYIK